jgi:hypothetical protein
MIVETQLHASWPLSSIFRIHAKGLPQSMQQVREGFAFKKSFNGLVFRDANMPRDSTVGTSK